MLDLSGAATGDRIPPKNFAGAAGLTFLEVSERSKQVRVRRLLWL